MKRPREAPGTRRRPGSVGDPPEEQAVGGSGDPGGGAGPRQEDFPHPFRCLFSLPRIHNGPDDIAHHVTKESPARDVDRATDPGRRDESPPYGRSCRTGDFAVHPCPRNEVKSCSPIRCESPSRTASSIECGPDVPGVAEEERGGDGGQVQEIPVLLLRRVAPRVERLRHSGSGEDADVRGKKGVSPGTIVCRSRSPESAKSTTCSRACTPRRCDPPPAAAPAPAGSGQAPSSIADWMVVPVRLHLPPGVRRPVVRDRQLDPPPDLPSEGAPFRSGAASREIKPQGVAPPPGIVP